MQGKDSRVWTLLLFLAGVPAIVWMALVLTPYLHDGLLSFLMDIAMGEVKQFEMTFTKDTPMTILLFLLAYAMAAVLYSSSRKNYRRGEEHGSAKWGSAAAINRRYMQKPSEQNKILTQNVRLGLDGRKHRRNLNVLLVGGSGAGKTRSYCMPNIMQANTSFVILDPKGEILRNLGGLLEAEGYEIQVLDLVHMEKSHCYNPFFYLRDDNDVQRLVTNLFKSTKDKDARGGEQFWDDAAKKLLMAMVLYLKYEAPEEEQNFAMVCEMLRMGGASEEEEDAPNALDNLFADLEMDQPDHIAVKYYNEFKISPAKTRNSVLITMSSRLDKFNLESVAALTMTDELDLDTMGERKMALFALIPDNDTSFNFLVSILYTQLFQQLFYVADRKYGGRLPVHCHFVMDEFSNVALPDDFDKILSVMRSREISVSIILQNLAQLKTLFKNEWESIAGNCDTFLYLGGNEQGVHKYVSELLGKETIDTNTYGKSSGRSGSYSTNYQNSGRDLLAPDEVRMLDNRDALILLRGELPIRDRKYDMKKHPNIRKTAEGGGQVYEHGRADQAVGTIEILEVRRNEEE